MRCPACGAENPEGAKRCPACGERTGRKARRREPVEEIDSPFARRPGAPNARALRAYRCAVYSLIPVAGLLLGPVAVVFALRAWRDAEDRGTRYAVTALAMGVTTLVCNGLGVALMLLGWMGS